MASSSARSGRPTKGSGQVTSTSMYNNPNENSYGKVVVNSVIDGPREEDRPNAPIFMISSPRQDRGEVLHPTEPILSRQTLYHHNAPHLFLTLEGSQTECTDYNDDDEGGGRALAIGSPTHSMPSPAFSTRMDCYVELVHSENTISPPHMSGRRGVEGLVSRRGGSVGGGSGSGGAVLNFRRRDRVGNGKAFFLIIHDGLLNQLRKGNRGREAVSAANAEVLAAKEEANRSLADVIAASSSSTSTMGHTTTTAGAVVASASAAAAPTIRGSSAEKTQLGGGGTHDTNGGGGSSSSSSTYDYYNASVREEYTHIYGRDVLLGPRHNHTTTNTKGAAALSIKEAKEDSRDASNSARAAAGAERGSTLRHAGNSSRRPTLSPSASAAVAAFSTLRLSNNTDNSDRDNNSNATMPPPASESGVGAFGELVTSVVGSRVASAAHHKTHSKSSSSSTKAIIINMGDKWGEREKGKEKEEEVGCSIDDLSSIVVTYPRRLLPPLSGKKECAHQPTKDKEERNRAGEERGTCRGSRANIIKDRRYDDAHCWDWDGRDDSRRIKGESSSMMSIMTTTLFDQCANDPRRLKSVAVQCSNTLTHTGAIEAGFTTVTNGCGSYVLKSAVMPETYYRVALIVEYEDDEENNEPPPSLDPSHDDAACARRGGLTHRSSSPSANSIRRRPQSAASGGARDIKKKDGERGTITSLLGSRNNHLGASSMSVLREGPRSGGSGDSTIGFSRRSTSTRLVQSGLERSSTPTDKKKQQHSFFMPCIDKVQLRTLAGRTRPVETVMFAKGSSPWKYQFFLSMEHAQSLAAVYSQFITNLLRRHLFQKKRMAAAAAITSGGSRGQRLSINRRKSDTVEEGGDDSDVRGMTDAYADAIERYIEFNAWDEEAEKEEESDGDTKGAGEHVRSGWESVFHYSAISFGEKALGIPSAGVAPGASISHSARRPRPPPFTPTLLDARVTIRGLSDPLCSRYISLIQTASEEYHKIRWMQRCDGKVSRLRRDATNKKKSTMGNDSAGFFLSSSRGTDVSSSVATNYEISRYVVPGVDADAIGRLSDIRVHGAGVYKGVGSELQQQQEQQPKRLEVGADTHNGGGGNSRNGNSKLLCSCGTQQREKVRARMSGLETSCNVCEASGGPGAHEGMLLTSRRSSPSLSPRRGFFSPNSSSTASAVSPLSSPRSKQKGGAPPTRPPSAMGRAEEGSTASAVLVRRPPLPILLDEAAHLESRVYPPAPPMPSPGAILECMAALGSAPYTSSEKLKTGPWVLDWYDFTLLVTCTDESVLQRIAQMATQYTSFEMEGESIVERLRWMCLPESKAAGLPEMDPSTGLGLQQVEHVAPATAVEKEKGGSSVFGTGSNSNNNKLPKWHLFNYLPPSSVSSSNTEHNHQHLSNAELSWRNKTLLTLLYATSGAWGLDQAAAIARSSSPSPSSSSFSHGAASRLLAKAAAGSSSQTSYGPARSRRQQSDIGQLLRSSASSSFASGPSSVRPQTAKERRASSSSSSFPSFTSPNQKKPQANSTAHSGGGKVSVGLLSLPEGFAGCAANSVGREVGQWAGPTVAGVHSSHSPFLVSVATSPATQTLPTSSAHTSLAGGHTSPPHVHLTHIQYTDGEPSSPSLSSASAHGVGVGGDVHFCGSPHRMRKGILGAAVPAETDEAEEAVRSPTRRVGGGKSARAAGGGINKNSGAPLTATAGGVAGYSSTYPLDRTDEQLQRLLHECARPLVSTLSHAITESVLGGGGGGTTAPDVSAGRTPLSAVSPLATRLTAARAIWTLLPLRQQERVAFYAMPLAVTTVFPPPPAPKLRRKRKSLLMGDHYEDDNGDEGVGGHDGVGQSVARGRAAGMKGAAAGSIRNVNVTSQPTTDKHHLIAAAEGGEDEGGASRFLTSSHLSAYSPSSSTAYLRLPSSSLMTNSGRPQHLQASPPLPSISPPAPLPTLFTKQVRLAKEARLAGLSSEAVPLLLSTVGPGHLRTRFGNWVALIQRKRKIKSFLAERSEARRWRGEQHQFIAFRGSIVEEAATLGDRADEEKEKEEQICGDDPFPFMMANAVDDLKYHVQVDHIHRRFTDWMFWLQLRRVAEPLLRKIENTHRRRVWRLWQVFTVKAYRKHGGAVGGGLLKPGELRTRDVVSARSGGFSELLMSSPNNADAQRGEGRRAEEFLQENDVNHHDQKYIASLRELAARPDIYIRIVGFTSNVDLRKISRQAAHISASYDESEMYNNAVCEEGHKKRIRGLRERIPVERAAASRKGDREDGVDRVALNTDVKEDTDASDLVHWELLDEPNNNSSAITTTAAVALVESSPEAPRSYPSYSSPRRHSSLGIDPSAAPLFLSRLDLAKKQHRKLLLLSTGGNIRSMKKNATIRSSLSSAHTTDTSTLLGTLTLEICFGKTAGDGDGCDVGSGSGVARPQQVTLFCHTPIPSDMVRKCFRRSSRRGGGEEVGEEESELCGDHEHDTTQGTPPCELSKSKKWGKKKERRANRNSAEAEEEQEEKALLATLISSHRHYISPLDVTNLRRFAACCSSSPPSDKKEVAMYEAKEASTADNHVISRDPAKEEKEGEGCAGNIVVNNVSSTDDAQQTVGAEVSLLVRRGRGRIGGAFQRDAQNPNSALFQSRLRALRRLCNKKTANTTATAAASEKLRPKTKRVASVESKRKGGEGTDSRNAYGLGRKGEVNLPNTNNSETSKNSIGAMNTISKSSDAIHNRDENSSNHHEEQKAIRRALSSSSSALSTMAATNPAFIDSFTRPSYIAAPLSSSASATPQALMVGFALSAVPTAGLRLQHQLSMELLRVTKYRTRLVFFLKWARWARGSIAARERAVFLSQSMRAMMRTNKNSVLSIYYTMWRDAAEELVRRRNKGRLVGGSGKQI